MTFDPHNINYDQVVNSKPLSFKKHASISEDKTAVSHHSRSPKHPEQYSIRDPKLSEIGEVDPLFMMSPRFSLEMMKSSKRDNRS
jgi:hypothetical protein